MKNRRIIVALTTLMLVAGLAAAQTKIDTERMDRDIEIAENALSTLIKQQFKRKGMWLEVKGSYTPGYGVTMRLPGDNSSWIYELSGNEKQRAVIAPTGTNVIIVGEDRDKDKARRELSRDSARTAYYAAMIKASKDFISDYGDLISQLAPEEKIMITNRGDGGRYYDFHKPERRQLVTVEGVKGDMTALKQGKITREQMVAKIKVVNTESTGEVETDLELLSSILGRLYRSDLSKTFYTDENIYYERLKDFGVIYYMQAYSGQEMNRRTTDKAEGKIWLMPTLKLEGLTQAERDKKVIELYPQFEKDLKDNIVEYAQTVKSLKNEEMFVFNVTLTKCAGCGIPSNLELSIKTDNIRKVAQGGISKVDAVASMNVKKGPAQ